MEEKWSVITDFPMYKVSTHGDVLNHITGNLISTSRTKGGLVKVGLVRDGVQYTRSLALFVADAFVIGRSDIFNTPIHLDGDQTNNRADNLMWRPRWFAWKFFHQFEASQYQKRGPIVDLATGIWYPTIRDVATTHGLLIKDIMYDIPHKSGVFPTWQTFSFRE